ncbi:MAG: dihydrodipicolinate synthase family protein [Balneola sp.]
MAINWNGVFPAVTTAFFENGNLDLNTFRNNIEAQIEAGVDGIIIGGSLGESSTITHDERLQLLHASIQQSDGRVPSLLNIAEGATLTAIELARKAEENGADGLMVLPPMMYKPTDDETVAHFKAIAESTSLPILLYNNPVDYKVEITLEMFEEFLPYENIQAVKESTRDISNVTRLKNKFGDRFKILCGVDTLAMEELVMGADGWVAGLVDAFPAETVAIFRLIQAGRFDEALKIYRWFLPLLELDINPQLIQNIKLAQVYTELGTEHVRAPRMKLTGAERARVINIIEEGLRTRPELPDYLNI